MPQEDIQRRDLYQGDSRGLEVDSPSGLLEKERHLRRRHSMKPGVRAYGIGTARVLVVVTGKVGPAKVGQVWVRKGAK